MLIIGGVALTSGQVFAAGLTIVFLFDLAMQGPFSTAFIEAVQKQGKNVVEALKFAKNVVQSKKQSKKSGKEKASDTPSWAKGKKPRRGESGVEFARRLCDEKYGKGNYRTGHGSDYNKLKKYGDRGGKQ